GLFLSLAVHYSQVFPACHKRVVVGFRLQVWQFFFQSAANGNRFKFIVVENAIEQRGLARAVGTEKAVYRALLYLKCQVVVHLFLSIREIETLYANSGCRLHLADLYCLYKM